METKRQNSTTKPASGHEMRVAMALRENLQKRKVQARERAAVMPEAAKD